PSPRWETHFVTFVENFRQADDILLADTPDDLGLKGMSIGDYAGLMSVGRSFYGVFSANNVNCNHFPLGVKYQRNVAPDGSLRLLDGLKAVAPSIDPFFFKATESGNDFYVRDWTESATSHDDGAEPSSRPRFWDSCDVWNRRQNSAGSFVDDRPPHENPGSG